MITIDCEIFPQYPISAEFFFGHTINQCWILRLITKEVATEEDMVEFEMNTSLLGELIPKSFPNFPITPKLDVLGVILISLKFNNV